MNDVNEEALSQKAGVMRVAERVMQIVYGDEKVIEEASVLVGRAL